MRSPTSHPAPDERGFILVGVVTFMLALTILGLSLFALSSYEAQFFYAATAREQSLQNSESGMELVKALLADAGSKGLEDAHLAEGRMGVTSAMAYQWRSASNDDTTSHGPVDWDSTMVIVVSARSGGVERTLQARYIPGVVENPYQRLLTAGQGVSVDTSPVEPELSGRVWQPVASDADTAWTDHVTWTAGRPVENGTPPRPLANAFVESLLPNTKDPTNASLNDAENYEIEFTGNAGGPTLFRSPSPRPTAADEGLDDEYKQYSFYIGDDLDIKVQNVVVWVVGSVDPSGLQGVCFKNRVRVRALDPSIPSTLVIVAKPGYANRGIWLKGGLKVDAGVQVYLVTEGDVSIVHVEDTDKSTNAGMISIVAGGHIEIGGPGSGDAFYLGYDPSSMDGLADQLLAQGALPQLKGGTGANFISVRQSWVETTPR
jgi:hypothetical protein